MRYSSNDSKRGFIKRLISTGTSFTEKPADKRNTIIANYFSLIIFIATLLLLAIRSIFFNISPDIKIITTGLLFLLPLLFNRFGFLFLARLYLCWLPSIAVMFIYITEGMKKNSMILASDYDSHRLYLLGFAVIPYLLLNLSNKKEFILGLSVPFITILFSYQVMNLFGLGHLYQANQGYGYELTYFRTIIAYFVISGCCLSMRMLVENEDKQNEKLISELEEKNKLIDQRAEEEIRKSENMYRSLIEQASDPIMVTDYRGYFADVNTSFCKIFGYTKEEMLNSNVTSLIDPEQLKERPLMLEMMASGQQFFSERRMIRKDGNFILVEANVKKMDDNYVMAIARDVTQLRKVQREIEISENMYRLLFEQAADAITLINKNKEFIRVNSSACEMFGYSKEEFLLLKLEDILDVDALKTNPLNFELLKGYKTVHNERILKRKDGSIFPAEINVRMLPDESFQSFVRDITDRKKAEQELIESETKFRNLVEQTLVGVYIIVNGKFAYVNPQFAQIFGYNQEELINSYPAEIVVHPDDKGLVTEYIRMRIEGEKDSVHYEASGLKKNGEIIQLEVFGSQTQYNGRPAIIGVLLDITENKLLQQQVLNQKVQEQKTITRAVLKAEEKERNRIGQELHDNVNQILIGTKLYLELAVKDGEASKELITSSLELIDRAIEEMRALSKSQVTPIRGIDLEELIYSLLDKLNAGSIIKTKVTYAIKSLLIEDDLKLNIYRIIQEQINNILKHANALQIIISLKDDEKFIYISIEDDGVGFDPEKKRTGIGLSNILNRIESFNGELQINTSPGNGCTLKITVPY
jgi:PAS domain S-box-containing protein